MNIQTVFLFEINKKRDNKVMVRAEPFDQKPDNNNSLTVIKVIYMRQN